MRDLRQVTATEFSAFLAAYPNPLASEIRNGTLCVYTDVSGGSTWPESLVASYLVPGPTRRRAGGYRIPVENKPDEDPEI